MFCPRCGRAVNETSNFCGGCGLSRAEIEKYIVKTEAPKAETAVPQPEEKHEPVTVSWESKPAEEAPQEAVKTEETTFAEKEFIAEAARATGEAKAEDPETETAQQTYSYTAQPDDSRQGYTQTEYRYTEPQKTYTEPADAYAEPAKAVKNENLSTVDFIWMMVISAIPVVGLIYLIVLAFSNDNTNKRSYARASLIISIFAFVISFVFAIGFILSGL